MNKHCLIILASYEYETLQLTLKALDHTITEKELPIVIILNGASNYSGLKVEKIARDWALAGSNRYVVRPLAAGKEPFFAIQEVIKTFPVARDAEFILKIDDDLIPLKKGWVTALANFYNEMSAKHGPIGFVTGLINNNSWGFKELVNIYDKWDEYRSIMNHPSLAGGKNEIVVKAGEINTGINGTVWQYPFLAAWLHSWTSLAIPQLIAKTEQLPYKEIGLDVHYSIGCTYSHRDAWVNLENKESNFDELLLNQYCKKNGLRRFALMDQPLLHLFYFIQRLPNSYLVPSFVKSLAGFFNDDTINQIDQITANDRLANIEEKLQLLKTVDTKVEKIYTVFQKVKNIISFKGRS